MDGNGFPADFLPEYWQKRPCNEPFELEPGLPALEPGELAWLATQADVESRLVVTERRGDSVAYRLENGPFTDEALGALPERDWTLLVQDVDKHLPAFQGWFDLTRFLPRWRIDDLMVSVAAPGGSVGPHLDNYDVFLCQGPGRRRWALGDPGDARPAESAGELSLLEPFEECQTLVADPGHVLYIPPRYPHWGVAQELCITYSIGFRAPTADELGATANRILGRGGVQQGGEIFYADPDLDATEADDGRISERTIGRIREQELLDNGLADRDLARIFGMTVTDPKAWLDPDAAPATLLEAAAERQEGCRVHGMALLAWYRHGKELFVFLNGRERLLHASWEPLVRPLCRARAWSADELLLANSLPGGRRQLAWLCENGLFDAVEQPQ